MLSNPCLCFDRDPIQPTCTPPHTHTDTHAQNILVKGEEGQGAEVKLVDAEKSMFGPCGFDMGQFLANFAFYMSQVRCAAAVRPSPFGRVCARW